LRLRFDDRDLNLLRGAEHVRGAALAHHPRPDELRDALSLSRSGSKLAHASPGASVNLEENEVKLLVQAIRFATSEVHWLSDQANQARAANQAERQASVLTSFPELTERGLWRSFGLCRDLERLADRLQHALSSHP
jgi:hypothetical protein